MKIRRVFEIIRSIALAIFLFVTLVPDTSNKILSIGSIIIWICMSIILDKEKFINFFIKPNLIMYSSYFWILTCAIYIITDYSKDIQYDFTNYIRIILTSILFLYYAKNNDIDSMKKIVIYSLLLITIVNIITIVYNTKYYNLSRLIATGNDLNINTVGVGSYFHIYGLLYPNLILIAYIIKKFKFRELIKKVNFDNLKSKLLTKKMLYRFLYISFIVISMYTIFITEFFIAFILLLIGLICIFCRIDSVNRFLKVVCILIVISILTLPFLRYMFMMISESTDSYNIKVRAQDIYILLSGGSLDETVDLKARLDVYYESIKAFISSPVLGIEFERETSNEMIGGHSTVLDTLGKYGIVGSIPLFMFLIVLCIETYLKIDNKWGKNVYLVCLIVFTIFLLVNTALFVTIFYMLFVLSPMILIILNRQEIEREK